MNSVVEILIELRDTLNGNIIFSVGALLITGYFLGLLAEKIRLPEITGYILAGLLLGKSSIGIVHHEISRSLKSITEVALGLIAMTIGGEFLWAKLKRMGKEVMIITATQLLLSFAAVSVGLYLMNFPLPLSLMLGAIASATAPAATVAIVQKLRARGRFIDYLYGIVALDDAGCVILFGVIFAVATGMMGAANTAGSEVVIILKALGEVGLSVVAGAVSGFLIHVFTRSRKSNNEIMIISLGIILATIAISITLHLSSLITLMASGCIMINLSPRNHRIFRVIEPMTPPIYALFFVIAGTELEPGVFAHPEILTLGAVYIFLRAAGKYLGVYSACAAVRVPEKTRNYLGLCMLPQAGVAIGLVLLIQTSPLSARIDPEKIVAMVNIILLSVFFNELTGPVFSRFAIVRALDIEEE